MAEWSKLKATLQDDIFNAYEHGIQLPEGVVAFYDQQRECLVDGANLQPLTGEAKSMAVAAFANLTPEQQEKNKSYLTFCVLYSDLVRREESEATTAFNAATQSRPAAEAEPVGQIVRRIFSSLLAPKC
jgi:hypothetical protein